MRSFFKYLLATITGIIIVSLIFFFITLGIISAITKSQNNEVSIEPGTILHLTLNTEIHDRSNNNPAENFDFQHMKIRTHLGLNDILANIAKAKADTNIRGVFLDLSILQAGQATVEEIRGALEDFKTSGKFIIADADYYTQKTYYLASVADSIYLTPTGSVILNGMSANLMYFKKALEKLNIEPQIFRKGKFKSAVEPFMQEEISKANQEQWQALLDAWWGERLEKISVARGIEVEQLNELTDQLAVRSDEDCKTYKLVDELVYRDQVIDKLKGITGTSLSKDLKVVSLSAYNKVPEPRHGKGIARDKIAVIYAEGEIVMGKGDDSTIGSEKISGVIRKARKDKKIKAIVLRVNSPGGSALASEVILREVELAAAEKPVVVSMGNLAASGGYYISAKATKVLAGSNTITGSIGVFGAMFNIGKMLDNKLGVTVSTVKTNKYADLGSPYRPIEMAERLAIQEAIDTIYSVFIQNVADGRGMSKEGVNEIAQGRVWSGKDAVKIGLVDEIGGLTRAIEVAKDLAEIDNYRILELPEQQDPLTELLKDLSGTVKVNQQKAVLGPLYPYYEGIVKLSEQKGVLARMPYNVEIN